MDVSEGPGPGGDFSEQAVSSNVRRWTKIALLSTLLAWLGFAALNEVMERRSIDYVSAEQIHAELVDAGFPCEDPYFPTGNSEPIGLSTATCERGLTTISIGVDLERGRWLGSRDAYESGEPGVAGSNWWVLFTTSKRRALAYAEEVQDILGGEIVEVLPQEDL